MRRRVPIRCGGYHIEFEGAGRHRDRLGAGFGPPWERPAETVREDVRQGYVTREAAARDYGVVLDPDTLAIDAAARAREGR